MADTQRTLRIKLEGVQVIQGALAALDATLAGIAPTMAAVDKSVRTLSKNVRSMTRGMQAHTAAILALAAANNTAAVSQTRLNTAVARAPKAFGPPVPTAAQYMQSRNYQKPVFGPPVPTAAQWKQSHPVYGPPNPTAAQRCQMQNRPPFGPPPPTPSQQAAAASQQAAAARLHNAQNKTARYGFGVGPTAPPTLLPGASSPIGGRNVLQSLNAQVGQFRVGAQMAMGSGGTAARMGGAGNMLAAGRAILANPVVAAAIGVAAAVVVGLVALGAAIHKTAEELSQFGALALLTGGSRADTASLKEMFAQMGIGGEHAGVMAGRMTERLSTDPQAMQWASRLGVNFMHGPYGDPNTGEKIVRILNRMSDLKGSQRTQAAYALAGGRNGDFVAMMKYLQSNTEGVRMTRRYLEGADRSVYTGNAVKQGGELEASWNLFASSMGTLAATFFIPFIPLAAELLQGFAQLAAASAWLEKKLGDVVSLIDPMTFLKQFLGVGTGRDFGEILKDFLGMGADQDKHTAAVEANTVQLEKFGRTQFGGGERFHSALTGNGERFSREADRTSMRFGSL